MEFKNILTHRVSCRKYSSQMPEDELIREIIDAALLGPIVRTHKLHLSVVTNKETMDLAENAADDFFQGKRHKPYLYGAPVWIILSGKKYEESEMPAARQMNENLFWNVGSLIENMELRAIDLGLASCGINTTIVSMLNRPEVKQAVGVPDGYEALASLVVGYAAQEAPERSVKPELIPVSFIK